MSWEPDVPGLDIRDTRTAQAGLSFVRGCMEDLNGGQTMELSTNENMEKISETFWGTIQKELEKWTPLLYDEGFGVAKVVEQKELDNAFGSRESPSLQFIQEA